ncbi:MAG: flagellar biosynthesis protein FlhB [Rhodospirillaceae bacterium]|nr:flagellar biosynthesis protein FlhB [Rhodospirillaceae bacterium]
MSESESGQEKTEDPTERRLEKAREDGEVLTSKELSGFATVVAGFASLWWFASDPGFLLESWSALFSFGSLITGDVPLLETLIGAFTPVLTLLLVLAIPMMLAAILQQLALGGLIFSAKAFHFKTNRISPIQGFKRMFGIQSLVELGKSVLKVGFVASIVILYFLNVINDIVVLPGRNFGQAVAVFSQLIPIYIFIIILALAVITGLDVSYQYIKHRNKLRMTPQEVKDDMKQSQGSPEVKQRVRKLQYEASRASREQADSIENVKDASVVITNPMHFAVAVTYSIDGNAAPTVLAMGKGTNAIKIIKEAEKHNVYVFRNIGLARALFFTSKINQEIETRLYSAVAIVLAYVFSLSDSHTGDNEEPYVDVPRDLRFSEDGKKV